MYLTTNIIAWQLESCVNLSVDFSLHSVLFNCEKYSPIAFENWDQYIWYKSTDQLSAEILFRPYYRYHLILVGYFLYFFIRSKWVMVASRSWRSSRSLATCFRSMSYYFVGMLFTHSSSMHHFPQSPLVLLMSKTRIFSEMNP